MPMRRETRVVLLTGNALRHRHAAAVLARSVNLVGILSEEKYSPLSAPSAVPGNGEAVIRRHLAERDAAEERLLGRDLRFPDTELHCVPLASVNSPRVVEWVRRLEPDVIALFGTGIVKPPLLDLYADCLINMHLGLSPYYRGSGTNFWPLVNREPECVGATIHLAVSRIDAGAIYAQVRPDVERGDRAHEIGTKAAMAGATALSAVVARHAGGGLAPQPQDLSRGRVYRRADFTPDAVRRMWHNLDTGMVDEYLGDAAGRRERYPIVDASHSLMG
jgi:hypothetical protein